MVDNVILTIQAGKGGDGVVHFRHTPSKPKAGPDGGDGGKGGSVYAMAVRDTRALEQYRNTRTISAQDGMSGSREERKGANGNDTMFEVPVGSVITNMQTNEQFYFSREGQTALLAVGGRGGFGNAYFKSSRETTPRRAVPGQPGQRYDIHIDLQLIADVGIVGMPNAGKSTLLNTLTGAYARVGSYPFTTLNPNLGVFHGLLLADIPGLIEGSAGGKGLGHTFLKHIKATRFLLHLVSLEQSDPHGDYLTVRSELGSFNKGLLDKPEMVVLTKSDMVDPGRLAEVKEQFPASTHVISVYDDDTLSGFQTALSQALDGIADEEIEFDKEKMIERRPI